MLRREYIFKFYLNAVHATSFFGAMSDSHPHTWEICLHISRIREEDEQPFHKIEEKITTFFHIYEGRDLNKIPPFDHQNPTMEMIAETFFTQLKNILLQNEWTLNEFMISENPARSYVIQNSEESETTYGIHSHAVSAKVGRTAGEEVYGEGPLEENVQAAQKDEKSILDRNTELNAAGHMMPSALTEEAVRAKEVIDDAAAAEAEKERALEEESEETETALDDVKEKEPQKKKKRPWVWILSGIGIAVLLLAVAVGFQLYLNRESLSPWGFDVWGHLFKGRFLYERMGQGEFYPLYMPEWYNGLQPFRYWPPLSYYILAGFYAITGGNPVYTNILFEILVFLVGAAGFVLWGKRCGRLWLGVFFGVIWFFVPDNMRVLYGEGNIPRVVITMLLPLFSCFCWSYLENGKLRWLVLAAVFMALITMAHLMITAMLGVTIFMVLMIYCLYTKRWERPIQLLIALVLGIAACAVWIIPALQGGIMGQSGAASDSITEFLMRPVSESLNPFNRLEHPLGYYYGLGFLLITVFGIVFAKREKKTGFIVALIIYIGTIDIMFPLISRLPFSQVFWMMRFTPFAMALILIAILLWKDVKRWVTLVITAVILVECVTSLPFVAYREEAPDSDIAGYQQAVSATSSRVALMDLSEDESFPSYYLPRNDLKNVDYVFGWAWQGATTGDNIVELNAAFEQESYLFLFDRLLEMGADTILFRSGHIHQTEKLKDAMAQMGYYEIFNDGEQIVCKRELPENYGTIAQYKGIAIGSAAENIVYSFPQFCKGKSDYIDEYKEEELQQYDTIYLSGFSYRDKVSAERIVKSLAGQGKQVVVDMNNIQTDLFTRRNTFMGVAAQQISYEGTYPPLVTVEGEIPSRPLPDGYDKWNTMYTDNAVDILGYTILEGKQIPFWTQKDGIQFVGLNLPFYAAETGYADVMALVGKIFKLNPNEVPQREIIPISVVVDGNHITIDSPRDGVLTTLAAVDGLKSDRAQVQGTHNLLAVDQGVTQLHSTYPDLIVGSAASIVFAGLLIAYLFLLRRRERKESRPDHAPAAHGGKEMPV